MSIYFGSGIVGNNSNQKLGTFDYGTFHDYRVEGDFRSLVYRLFIDGQFASYSTNAWNDGWDPPGNNFISLGDLSGGANAKAEVAGFSFYQPRFSISNADAQSVKLQWLSVAGKQFQVQRTSQLPPTIWINVGDLIPGDNTPKTLTDPLTGQSGFYRLLISP